MKPHKLVLTMIAAGLMALGTSAAAAEKNPGTSRVCGDFGIGLDLLLVDFSVSQRPDEGWAWVDPSRKLRSVTGNAHGVHIAASDTPANHDSHDVDFEIRLDPGQEDLITVIQIDSIGIEWESGLDPHRDKKGDGAATFPKWAWPSDGDRAWAEGHWILDCGHPVDYTADGPKVYHAEIHPPRAFASMRDQAAPLPGTGTTPVPVSLTDLFISGRGGYTVQQLNCGPEIILGDHPDTCGQETPPPDDSYKTTPINDTDFSFDVCLPPRPPNSVFGSRVDLGPGNSVAIDPILRKVAAAGGCLVPPGEFGDFRFDRDWMMHVTVPLRNTDTPPQAVYARHIYAGWIAAPNPVLPHRRLTLNSVDLHNDHDTGSPGELTFWWMNVNAAPSPWIRLSDHTNDNMNDFGGIFDDSERISYQSANWEFYLRNHPGDHYAIASRGFEQDCFDNGAYPIFAPDGTTIIGTVGYFGVHQLRLGMYFNCYVLSPFDFGPGDPIDTADALFFPATLGSQKIAGGSDYDLNVTVEEIPIADEDTADLSIASTMCTSSGEVALVGQPLTCRTNIPNAGPGLPRLTHARNTFSGSGAVVNSGAWTYAFPFGDFNDPPCTPAGAQVLCDLGTVPTGGAAVLTITATPTAAGMLIEQATAEADSTDPVGSNNTASTTINVFMTVSVDIQPGDATNVVQLERGGPITVAILSTPQFNAANVDPSTICFGDAEAPAERTCAEVHGRGHLEDVNRDRVPDLVLHFDLKSTGIDLGDRNACLKGRTTGGIGIYGCDAIAPK